MHATGSVATGGVLNIRQGRPGTQVALLPRLAVATTCASAAGFAAQSGSRQLNAAQIVEKNVAARGGLDAWRKIQTMVWVGHVESPNAQMPSVPFVLQQKRPNRTRFEMIANNQRSLRVFDGV